VTELPVIGPFFVTKAILVLKLLHQMFAEFVQSRSPRPTQIEPSISPTHAFVFLVSVSLADFWVSSIFFVAFRSKNKTHIVLVVNAICLEKMKILEEKE
jgi:hypothetical protein